MAVAVRSSTTARDGSGGSNPFSLSVPSGATIGDVLLLHHNGQNDSSSTLAADGWTLLDNHQRQAGSWASTWYRVVTTTPPSSYTMPTGSAGMLAVSGSNFNSVSLLQSSGDGSSSAPSITPNYANSLIALFVTSSSTSVSGYAIATSPPTFTEQYDPGSQYGIACATGVRPQTTATGVGTATATSAVLQMVVVAPAQDVNFSASLYTLALSLMMFPFNASVFSMVLNFLGATGGKWNPAGKSDSSPTWTPETKT